MRERPSVRRGRQIPAGARAETDEWSLHDRNHQQEETLKISKFGWLAALVAVAAVLGAVAYSPQSAEAITGVTKTCTTPTTSCQLQFTTSALTGPGGQFLITLSPGTVQFDPTNPPTLISTGTCTGTMQVGNVTGASYTITRVDGGAAALCPVGATFVVAEPVLVSGNGVVTQTVAKPVAGTGGAVEAAVVSNVVAVTAPAAFVTTISVAPPCPLTITLTPEEIDDFVCFLEIDDNSMTPDLVSSGIVNVTVGITTPGGVLVGFNLTSGAISGVVSGSTGNVRCGAVNTDNTCDGVLVAVQVEGAGAGVALPNTATVSVTANYVPDNPSLNTPANLASTTLATVITQATAAGFRAGTTFIIRCPTTLNPGLSTTFPLVVPGPIGGATPIAIGILPGTLICEALFVDADGDPEIVAPGTIEISSLNGTLVNLNGGLSTNLRIPCDAASNVSQEGPSPNVIDPNTCAGVRFGVLGVGVGFTELRARYEPSTAAAAAGILEREASATVAFIAPPAVLNLLLNPNPVGVGANGTATARFNRTAIFAETLLINPQTGAPLTISLGTPLNGTVTFTSSAPNIAAFTGGITTGETVVTGTVTTPVTVATAATITVRCGSVSAAVAGAPFVNFFGGCVEVSAQYRGLVQGSTNITATFIADLPGSFGAVGPLAGNVTALVDQFGSVAVNQRTQTLEVVGVVASTQRLVPGCNNVVAPVSETVAQVAARVDPAAAAISIWKQVPGTTQFQGAAIGGNVPASVSNLTSVNALDAIFICVNAAATYRV